MSKQPLKNDLSNKIDELDIFSNSQAFQKGKYMPDIDNSIYDNMVCISDSPEYTDWQPGIYLFVNVDTCRITYQDSSRKYYDFSDIHQLNSFLHRTSNSFTPIPVFLAASRVFKDNNLINILMDLQKTGIPVIKVIFLKDKNSNAKYAFDSFIINQIKHQVSISDLTRAKALAKAVQPLLRSCPAFMIDLDTIMNAGKSPEQRLKEVVLSLKRNIGNNECNLKNILDFCFLVCLPWSSFTVKEYKIDELIKNTSALSKQQ